MSENNKETGIHENENILNLSPGKVKALKWLVAAMTLTLILGFGLVIYKMTELIIKSVERPSNTVPQLSSVSQSLVAELGLDNHSIEHISVSEKNLAIHLKAPDGRQEIWIYNLRKNAITNKIKLKR